MATWEATGIPTFDHSEHTGKRGLGVVEHLVERDEDLLLQIRIRRAVSTEQLRASPTVDWSPQGRSPLGCAAPSGRRHSRSWASCPRSTWERRERGCAARVQEGEEQHVADDVQVTVHQQTVDHLDDVLEVRKHVPRLSPHYHLDLISR